MGGRQRLVSSPPFFHPSNHVVDTCFSCLFRLKMGLHAGKHPGQVRKPNRLTHFHTRIHTCGRVRGCSQPSDCRRKLEHPEEKPCEVKSSQVYLYGPISHNMSQWASQRQLFQAQSKLCKKTRKNSVKR